MSLRIEDMYHLAGTMHDTHCSITGRLSIGNIIPERKTTGTINVIAETIRAANCVSTSVDINSPIERAMRMYIKEIQITFIIPGTVNGIPSTQ